MPRRASPVEDKEARLAARARRRGDQQGERASGDTIRNQNPERPDGEMEQRSQEHRREGADTDELRRLPLDAARRGVGMPGLAAAAAACRGPYAAGEPGTQPSGVDQLPEEEDDAVGEVGQEGERDGRVEVVDLA